MDGIQKGTINGKGIVEYGLPGSSDKMNYGEIAQALGVSRTTVSRAMSGKGRISNETRRRIREYAAAHGGYESFLSEEEKGEVRTNNIALVIPRNWKLIDLPFFQHCMIGVTEAAMSRDYDTMIVMAGDKDIDNVKRLTKRRKVDGFVLTRTYVRDVFVSYLKEAELPFVTLGSIDDPQVIQIDHDHQQACHDMVSAMIAKGMRRIAIVGNNRNHIVTNLRFNGYCSGLEDNRIHVNPDYIFLNGDNKYRIENIVEEIINRKIEGILCMDDTLCRWIITRLRRQQIRVPGQIRVASCYDSEILEDYTPSVTSIRFDAVELGREACKILLDLISGGTPPTRTFLGYEIISRDSTK